MEFKIGDKIRLKNYTGTIKYVGLIENRHGRFVGIELDEGEGKNNGTVGDRRYFDTNDQMTGIFVEEEYLKKQMKQYKLSYDELKNRLVEANYKLELQMDICKNQGIENEKLMKSVREWRERVNKNKIECNLLYRKIDEILENVKNKWFKNSYVEMDENSKRIEIINLIESLIEKIELNEPVEELYEKFKNCIKK